LETTTFSNGFLALSGSTAAVKDGLFALTTLMDFRTI